MNQKLKVDPKLFKGVYDSTAVAPTEREIEYVMTNLANIINSKNSRAAVNHGLECSCGCNDDGKEVIAYDFNLDETMTDVPADDWDDNDVRVLTLLLCCNCGEWCLCD